MGATATLSTSDLSVEPGQQVACSVLIRNNGEVTDDYAIDVVGEAAGWSVVEPPAVNLNPGDSAEVVVRFAPPRSADVLSGVVPFGVRVMSRQDPHGSVVEEGRVTIGAFADVAAELVPATAEGGRRAKFQIAVDNVGNTPSVLRFRPSDPDNMLDFKVDRPEIMLPPGTTAFVGLQAKPRKTFLRGDTERHPFQVAIEPENAEPLVASGTMVQHQLLPKWLLPALIALLVVAGALVVLWFSLLRGAVQSAARDAAKQETAEIKGAADAALNSAGAAKEESKQAKENSDRAMEAVGIDPNPSDDKPAPPKPPALQTYDATDFRVAANAPINANAQAFNEFSFTPPNDKTLVVSDVILQNPRGDSGTIRILRDVNGTKTTLLEVGLGNFRDLDHHFVQGWRFKPGEKVVLAVSCQNPQNKGNCTPAASFSGRLE